MVAVNIQMKKNKTEYNKKYKNRRNFLIIKTAIVCFFISGSLALSPLGSFLKSQIDSRKILKNLSKKTILTGEDQLFEIAFSDNASEKSFYYQAITNLKDIKMLNSNLLVDRNQFKNAFEQIKILNTTQINRQKNFPPVIRVQYLYQQKVREAFAYGTLPKFKKNILATLVIPGSGLNQSQSIYQQDKKNYHYGVFDALDPFGGQVFVLIKPNEDFLAWHNGHGKKISGNFIWNWQLNRGGSYSVSYLIDSLAFAKYLKKEFKKLVLAGLSQGGGAVLLNALQSEPDAAIISAGHTVVNTIEYSAPDQLVAVPGYANLFEPDYLVHVLGKNKTYWLFTFGRKDSDIYKIEADNFLLADALKEIKTVSVISHNQGHIFPKQEINDWLQSIFDNKKYLKNTTY